MKVLQRFWPVAILLTGFTTACSQIKSADRVYPKLSPTCAGQAIPGSHMVRWIDGHVTLETGGSREQFIQDFVVQNLDRIEFVEPNFKVQIQNMARATAITSFADNWGAKRINASEAWVANARGGGITIAVIDSGIDTHHNQLKNQLATNPGEMGRDSRGRDKSTNGIDDDNNGLIDDATGFNFVENNGDPTDTNSHGTHVSGIIVAEHEDSLAAGQPYVEGIAPQAKILPLRFIDSTGSGDLYSAMRAIDYAAERGAQVINASWGGSECSLELRDQIAGLLDKKVIFVAAAGNDSIDIDQLLEFPASYNLPSQITVGAVGVYDYMADFSNYGYVNVHLFAPGTDIASTVPNNQIASMSGTSMATPFVAGAIAVLLSRKPQATISQIRAALYQSGRKSAGYHNASQGRLDLGAALTELDRILN